MEESFRHLKRIRRIPGADHVKLLICPTHLSEKSALEKELMPILDTLLEQVQVPIRHPVTKNQYAKWNSHWPLAFHESTYERLKVEELNHFTKLFSAYKNYFIDSKLSLLIVENNLIDLNTLDESLIIFQSESLNHNCPIEGALYPFDHLVLKVINENAHSPRIVKNGKVPYLLSGCVAILAQEPCTMCSMSLLHSRIDAVIYFKCNSTAGALGSICLLHSEASQLKLPLQGCQRQMSELNKRTNTKPRIVSLRDLNGNNHEDCSSDDEKQTYYTGGEKSGTAVHGNGPKAGTEKTLKSIFSKATAQQSRPAQDEKDSMTEVVSVHLIFWSEGLSVNDGPLRPYSDPATLRFLEQIRMEIVPDELDINPNAAVDFKMTQVPGSTFDQTKQAEILKGVENVAKKTNPFSGNAETLGDANNDVIFVNSEAIIAENITTTRIQVVLPNGSKKVVTINPRATIAELYSLIQQEFFTDLWNSAGGSSERTKCFFIPSWPYELFNHY